MALGYEQNKNRIFLYMKQNLIQYKKLMKNYNYIAMNYWQLFNKLDEEINSFLQFSIQYTAHLCKFLHISKYQPGRLMASTKILVISVLIASILTISNAGTAQEWRSRTIYQVLTDRFARNDGGQNDCSNLGNYCGGGYVGLKNHLDYIQGMGFDAIWISPIIDNYDGGYHGYWGRNLYTLNQHFGSQQNFVDFVTACHAKGIWVMVDVVANHMGNTNQNYSQNVPFNSSEHYHDYCIISDQDFATKNQNKIENCRLAGLADLKQQNQYVRTTLLSWIHQLVTKYHIDGIRIDTVPETPKWFWAQFKQSAGVYTLGQVFEGDMSYNSGYLSSLDAVLNYPFFFWTRDTIFNNKDMTNFRSYYNQWAKRINLDKLHYLANFVDNHDNARVLSWGGSVQDKRKHYKTANVLALTSIGIPIIYYGTQQYFAGGNDPRNRQILWRNMDKNSEMYKYLATVISARKKYQIWSQTQVERYADNQIFAYSRGKFLVLLTNKVSGTVSKFISYHPFTAGQVICNIFYPTTDCITVNSGGFNINLLNGQAKIYVPK